MQVDDEIRKLTDYEHARLRTNMYLGSTAIHTQEIIIYDNRVPVIKEMSWVPAIYTAYREVLDNALDEINHGYGNRIDVEFDEDTGIFSVADNGRGIPIEKHPSEKMHMATMVMCHARAGRNFGERGEVAGTNGIGASVVNFCSEWFELEIHRDGKVFRQKFNESDKGHVIGKPSMRKVKSTKTGTKVRFKLSDNVFSDKTLPTVFLYSRVYEIAACNPTIRVYWNGKKVQVAQNIEKSMFPSFDKKPIVIDIDQEKFHSSFYLLPNFKEGGEIVHTLVNNIPAFNGGVHVDTFKRCFYTGLLKALEGVSKRRKLTPNRSDIGDGLLIYNVTHMEAPDFDSQSKTRLINEPVGKVIKEYFDNEDAFKTLVRKSGDWINEIYDRCAQRTQKKDNRDTARMSKKLLRGKVPDLRDAASKDRQKCILFLGEGESAISGFNNVRDSDYHGVLALQGKVVNVNGEQPRKILENSALSTIMASCGLAIGNRAIRNHMNYGKVYIATDADPDGLNIGALLINFFYSCWPELFDPEKEPVFHIFMTPFVIARKGKQTKYWYSHNYTDFDPDKYKGWEITRAKGLAALLEDDWAYSLKNPELYPVVDDGKMEESLDLVFNGKRADDRKSWIGL